jgi:DNA-3-methyladenine glycosylase
MKLLSGPGRLCAALGITAALSGIDLLGGGDFRLFQVQHEDTEVRTSKRIGVDYAGEAAEWPLRFFAAGSNAVSGPLLLRTAK